MALALCACPPLEYKVFVRNHSADTVRLMLRDDSGDTTVPPNWDRLRVWVAASLISSEAKRVVNQNGGTAQLLPRGAMQVVLPPRSTAFVQGVNGVENAFPADRLVVSSKGINDTPGLARFRRRADPAYNYFYRTILSYDIR